MREVERGGERGVEGKRDEENEKGAEQLGG